MVLYWIRADNLCARDLPSFLKGKFRAMHREMQQFSFSNRIRVSRVGSAQQAGQGAVP
jgi:hypothetical protein